MLPFIYWLYDDLFVVNDEILYLKTIPKCITWSVNEKINSKENIYLQILSEEDNMKLFFPHHSMYETFSIHLNIMKKTKTFLTRKCFYRSLNESLILDFYNEFNEYAKFRLNDLQPNINYENIVDVFILLSEIEKYPLKLRGKLKGSNPYLKFSPFTKTGRLRTVSPFFPLYSLEKSLRIDILPKNDYILEIDFNAAELRIFLALMGLGQPQDDAYEEVQRIFNLDSRTDAKQKVFEILYSNHYDNIAISSLLEKYRNGNTITTPYGYSIYLDEKTKQINYLCQSTCSSLIYEKSLEIMSYFKNNNSKSKLLFPFHDAVVVDLHKDDIHKIREIKNLFSSTRFGFFGSRCRIGTNYYNLEEIK